MKAVVGDAAVSGAVDFVEVVGGGGGLGGVEGEFVAQRLVGGGHGGGGGVGGVRGGGVGVGR